MKILVCGSRDWDFRYTMEEILLSYCHAGPPIIIHGACRGADEIADEVAHKMGWEVRPYPADWGKHGKAAGPIRNSEMLDKEKPDIVVAFVTKRIDDSKGTFDLVQKAAVRGISTDIITLIYESYDKTFPFIEVGRTGRARKGGSGGRRKINLSCGIRGDTSIRRHPFCVDDSP